MGVIRVVIESESGQRNNEGVMLPSNIFPNPADGRFQCLRFVDPYGDATFNRLQMPYLLADLRKLKDELSDDSLIKTLNLVEGMAKECEDGVHLCMKFLGD